jgi:hypothetical protein
VVHWQSWAENSQPSTTKPRLIKSVSRCEVLPASHLARFVVDLAAQLDVGRIYAGYAVRGGIAYAPKILLALLF